MYVIGLSLLTAYGHCVASSAFSGYNDAYSVDMMKVEKQQSNPWATKPSPETNENQNFPPNFPQSEVDRYITDEELNALNNQSSINSGSSFSNGWMPLPLIPNMMQNRKYESPSYFQTTGNRKFRNDEVRENSYNKPWGGPMMELPIDPMDPGRYGSPFGQPSGGIDSFMYE